MDMVNNLDSQIEDGKATILQQIRDVSKYIYKEEVEEIAEKCGLSVGTVKQIRKGQTFNMNAALMLLQVGRSNRDTMMKTIREAIGN